MNSILKRRLRIINLISISFFFLILIFSCNWNLKPQKPSEENKREESKKIEEDIRRKEEDENFDPKTSSEFLQRRIKRDFFSMDEKDIKTIEERYRENPFSEISFVYFNGFGTSKRRRYNRFHYKDISGEKKELMGYQIDGEKDGIIVPIKFLFENYLYYFFLQRDSDMFNVFQIRLDEKDVLPRILTKDDIPKLKEILNLK